VPTVAAAADNNQPCPGSGHVSRVVVARSGEPSPAPGGWAVSVAPAFEPGLVPVRRPRRVQRRRRRRDGPLQVARAIPTGHARARSQQGWLADVQEHPALQLRRADAQEHILAVAAVLAAHASWETFLTRPTWAVLQARTGLSRRAVARHLAWLRRVGLLAIVAGGTTPEFSPGILRPARGTPEADQEANEASVYVLMAPHGLRLVAVTNPDDRGYEYLDDSPDIDQDHDQAGHEPAAREDITQPRARKPVDTSGTPTPSGLSFNPRTRARTSPSGASLRSALKTSPPMRRSDDATTADPPPWPAGSTPASKQERLAAAAQARRQLWVLRGISTAHVAALFGEWWLAGWTLADVLHALAARPDGTTWQHADGVRHIPGWTRHRLAAWRADPTDPMSPPGRSPAARAAARATQQRAAARARAERRATAEAARPTGPDTAAVRAGIDALRAAHQAALERAANRRRPG
jgi:hypothetical protein